MVSTHPTVDPESALVVSPSYFMVYRLHLLSDLGQSSTTSRSLGEVAAPRATANFELDLVYGVEPTAKRSTFVTMGR